MNNTALKISTPREETAVNISISKYRAVKVPDRSSPVTSRGIKKATAADPIREATTIHEIADYLLTHGKTKKLGLRNRMAFILGVTTGLRVSDLLKIKISDVLRADGSFFSHIIVREKKTHKTNDPKLGAAARQAIKEYLEESGSWSFSDYLIKSSKGGKISVSQFWRILNDAQVGLGLDEHISTHTMRKTCGYMTIRQNPDDSLAVVHLQQMFNHSSIQTTLNYCGISRDEQDKYYDGVNAIFD